MCRTAIYVSGDLVTEKLMDKSVNSISTHSKGVTAEAKRELIRNETGEYIVTIE